MARQDEFQAQSPVQLYYDWRSDENSFCYYDKDADIRIPAGIPFKFAVLKQVVRITGVDPNGNIGLYSNEVRYTTKEELIVRRQDNTEVARGFWKDIKDVVKNYGGHYTKIVYAMDIDNVVICLRIRGESLLSWGHVVGKYERRQNDEWILNDSFEEKEYTQSDGKVQPYSVPSFKFGGSLSTDEMNQVNESYDLLYQYFEGRSNNTSQSQTTVPSQSGPPADLFVPPAQDDDDLPF